MFTKALESISVLKIRHSQVSSMLLSTGVLMDAEIAKVAQFFYENHANIKQAIESMALDIEKNFDLHQKLWPEILIKYKALRIKGVEAPLADARCAPRVCV